MPKCAVCKRKAHSIHSYGGAILCEDCYEFYNPPVTRVYKLTDKQRDNINSQIRDLESKIRKLNLQLRQDDEVRASGSEFLDYTTSYSQAFKNKKLTN